MNNIDAKKWKEFVLSEIFEIKKTKNIIAEEAEEKIGGNFPYVTRSGINNGVNFFVNENFKFNHGNSISIAGEGASIFYQEKDFITGNNINILSSNKLNKFNALFIVTIISLEKYRYSYNRAFNSACIKKTKIKLPAKNDKPDWEFMENYIKELFKKERESNELSKSIIKHKPTLEIKKWKYFELQEILPTQKVKKFSSIPDTPGLVPFISSSSENQGVVFFSNVVSESGKSITISTNGSCFDCFFHQKQIGISTDVEIISAEKISSYASLFIITILNLEKFRWTYGRKPKKGLVNKTKIMLPVDENNNPDWKFMEKYIKSLPYSKYI